MFSAIIAPHNVPPMDGFQLSDLKDDVGLKYACNTLLEQVVSLPGNQRWIDEFHGWLERVRDVSHDEFLSEKFQLSLWNAEAVSATGMGHIDISAVAKDAQVAEMLWQLKQKYSTTLDAGERELLISEAWRLIAADVALLTRRNPRLKMYRVFALLCPGAFTTITHFRKLRELAFAMGLPLRGQRRHLHQMVLNRLDKVLGVSPDFYSREGTSRLTLPWLLYSTYVQNPEPEATEKSDPVTGEERLNPLAPERRRRGMVAIGGGTATIQTMIEFAAEGCTREDFMQHLQSISPRSKKATFNIQLNALIAEWGVLRASGGDLHLTLRGEAFLESGEPDEVIDWMITRILGFDYLLYALNQNSLSSRDAILVLRKANPGWTSDFAPSSLIGWLRNLDLVSLQNKLLQLTESGKQWVQRIHWVPRELATDTNAEPVVVQLGSVVLDLGEMQRPSLKHIIAGFSSEFPFPESVIGQLDAGLWCHSRRHFAVLTGLSGAGKTQLALRYALSLWQGDPQPSEGVLVVPVQPGWHDYSSLLGYVNPIEPDTYMRTAVLDFLLQASSNPLKPYTLILDEMNLSHPEQYLAPLLSAMETGEAIVFHGQAEAIDDVPPSIPYPSNLVIIGTVNMDETTHGLSDKVLDRASVIEFWDIDVAAFPGWTNSSLTSDQTAIVRDLMVAMMSILRPARLHFGWRTLHDILGYLQQTQQGQVIEFSSALDQAVYSKILPKLRGEDSPRLQRVFASLKSTLAGAKMHSSLGKATEMGEELNHSGSTRFWR
ncbi:McrB family protein [Pseudomonas sp. SJZ131]|uniref:McrB family protein n=1 Tax=Pseudomonas sp. SJZ131 TaxID=2572895 RepID=UPI00119959BF|nr:hypothetical protein [Pseudomonas sp. SJZ131]TWD52275.1 hypothetical protein FBY12_0795 [Pseudomonas sp. SJZ131]